jgi:hypothetical protein
MAMNHLDIDEVCSYVNENIDHFHKHKIEIIAKLKLQILIRKNPYLFRAKNITKASELIEGTLEAFLSSSEEKLFGDFLEDLAIFIAAKSTSGRKSSAPGMDLEFEKDGTSYVVSIKSGPNWGNSSQHAKLAADFANAEIRLRQTLHKRNIQKVLGICYGKTKTAYSNKGYLKVVGQNFWTLISDDTDLYIKIIEPVGYKAREHNENYHIERDRITNLLNREFVEKYCLKSGEIDWGKLLKANSGNYDLDEFFKD